MSVNANPGEWEPQQRRTGSLVALGLAVLLAAVGVGTWFFLKDQGAMLYWVLVGLLALVLLFTLALLVLGMRADRAREEPHAPHVGPTAPHHAEEEAAAYAAPAESAVKVISLRCGDCGTVFDITDTGERPLYHTCPGCGAEGVLRTPAVEAASAAAAPAPTPESAWAPPEEAPEETPAPAPAPAAPPRRLKLRCGGCKEVFVIEDTGERPLRRPCPHCSRMGEIR